ncbi:MAG: FHA domain-containing protein [Deltaproteobacteria bacterium]|nr:FHA domain-containing protein [Deltaproteobacteria bacterium]MBW2123007.1 FHA domain-containing protein [Deltaproteobacteria bacterium]
MDVGRPDERPRRERRRTARSEADLPGLILLTGRGEKRVRTGNVSLGGLMVRTDGPLPTNQEIRIGFIAGSSPIEAEGRVVYSLKMGSGYVSGFSFIRVSPNDMRNLTRYLEGLRSLGSEEAGPDRLQGVAGEGKGSADATEVILPDSRVSALLIMKGDDGSEKKIYEINHEVTSIGRHEDNDIVLADPSVSAHHAKIRFEEGSYFIYDFASTNGTRVNGIKTYRKRIKDGDMIEIGQPAFTFLIKRRRSRSPRVAGD